MTHRICKAHTANLETILRAAADGRLALLEVYDSESKRVRAAIVAVGNDEDDFVFTPFALMVDGNPYETLSPPAGDKPDMFLDSDGNLFAPTEAEKP